MKALTLWQPYAQAIALGLKQYETRSWATKYRGPLAIHCSVKKLSKEYTTLAGKYGILDKLHYGKIIAVCELADCLLMTDELIKMQSQSEIDFGDWRAGRYAWKLQRVEVLPVPKESKGRQGLWNTDLFPDWEENSGSKQFQLPLGE